MSLKPHKYIYGPDIRYSLLALLHRGKTIDFFFFFESAVQLAERNETIAGCFSVMDSHANQSTSRVGFNREFDCCTFKSNVGLWILSQAKSLGV